MSKVGRLRIAALAGGLSLAAVLAVTAMFASGAGGSTGATISGLESLMWSPMEVTITPGSTVTFQNTSTDVPHGVVWKSGPETPHCEGVPIDEGRTNWKGTCTFSKEGVYEFYCYVHGMKMSGKVMVAAGGTTTTSSSSSKSSTTSASSSTTSTTGSMSSMQMGGYSA